MKKLFLVILATLFLLSAGTVLAETLTFEWTQADLTNLKEWKLLWSDTQGGPYVDLTTIGYDGSAGPSYSSPADVEVTGKQGTHAMKYFVLRACGDIPQQDGSTSYLCSKDSNEVSKDFWIPAGTFSVPLNFEIVPN